MMEIRLICLQLQKGIVCAAILVGCFFIILSPVRAHASYIYCSSDWGVSDSYYTGKGGSSNLCGTSVYGSYASTTTTSKGTYTFYSGQGSAYSDASMGVNRVDVSGSIDAKYGYGAFGTGGGGSDWFDSINIVSLGKPGSPDYLPNGTPVAFQTSFYIDASAKASSSYPADNQFSTSQVGGVWNEWASINFPGDKLIQPIFPSGWTGQKYIIWNPFASFYASNTQWPVINNQGTVTGYEGDTSPSTEIIIDSMGKVGSTYGIGVSLSASAGGVEGSYYRNNLYAGYVLSGSATLDASQTALFGLQILTPGASYISQSGTLYPTSVIPISATPEPSALALFGTGILGLAIRARRTLQTRSFLIERDGHE